MKKVVYILLCVIIVSLFLHLNDKNRISNKISDYNDIVFMALASEDSFSELKLSIQDNGKDYYNYWAVSVTAITEIRDGNIEKAIEIIDRNIDTFYHYGYFPRPAYKSLDYGWVSCMDAPVVGVASQMLYEITGDEKYEQFVRDVSEYILSDVSEHGFVSDIGGSKWIFEYANTQTNKENGEFVLNGSLLGTLTIEILAQITENKDLERLVNSSIKSYEQYFSKYWYSDDSWCYYKLNELRVNQPHYVIYEIRLLDALYEVTGKSIFNKESRKRRELLKSYYTLVVDECDKYTFIRAGAPHYYYMDIHDTILNFYNNEGQLLTRDICSGSSGDKFYMQGVMPQNTSSIQWIIQTKHWSVDMGDLVTKYNTFSVDLKDREIPVTFNASGDVELNGGGSQLKVYYNTGKLTISGKLDQLISIEKDDIVLIEFKNMSDITIETTNVIVYDEKDNSASRYLTEITPGNSVIFFSPIGFVQSDVDYSKITGFNVRLYTVPLKYAVGADIEIGNVYKFNNQFEYYQYLEERKITGNESFKYKK